MKTHLCLVAPDGYVHSAALADPLAHFQHQLARAGAEVTVARNALDGDAVNFVFGAHLGFDRTQLDRFRCVVVNLEQVARDGAVLDPEYLDLLRRTDVVDYHSDNAVAYQRPGHPAHVVRFGHAPYLEMPIAPLEERPIDLLFLGVVTKRRAEVLGRVIAAGVKVVAPPAFVYGEERDELVRNAKAVLNVSAYASTRFEQVRASVVLSCGTPVITEDRAWRHEDDAWMQPYVHRFDAEDPAAFFKGLYGSEQYFASCRDRLDAWKRVDVSDGYRQLLGALTVEHRKGFALSV